jgi:hypothetical protein
MEKVLLEIGSPPDFQFSVARTSQSPFPLYVIATKSGLPVRFIED